MKNKPTRGRPRKGAELKNPNDYPRLVIRPPKGSETIIRRMKKLAKREGLTIGEIWIDAAKLRLSQRGRLIGKDSGL
jgi:hypothetical protein